MNKIPSRLSIILLAAVIFASCRPALTVHAVDAADRTVQAAEDARGAFDEMIFRHWQMLSVNTDMMQILVWGSGDKGALKKAGSSAVSELGAIRSKIESLAVPEGLKDIKAKEVLFADGLIRIYSGIESKGSDTLDPEFESIRNINESLSSLLNQAFNDYRNPGRESWQLDPFDVESGSIQDEIRRDTYKGAIKLMKEKKFDRAAGILKKMAERSQGDPFINCLYLRIADCSLINNAGADPSAGDISDGLFYLNKAVDTDKYNPALFESFLKWRTVTQAKKYGMLNSSPIPNGLYNAVRLKMMAAVKAHLRGFPDDVWARAQLARLLMIPIIERGGTEGNNSNIEFWQELFAKNT
jgi:hypothetical protein